jgi:non-ribosomal peptide synthetase component F
MTRDRIVRCFVGRPTRFIALFDDAVASSPQAEALVFEGQRWTYAELAPMGRAPGRPAGRRRACRPATAW